jgi:hypothetical protein
MYLGIGVSLLHGLFLQLQEKEMTSVALQMKLVSSEKRNVLSLAYSRELKQLPLSRNYSSLYYDSRSLLMGATRDVYLQRCSDTRY